ncbi:hypothetical protein A2U01_0083888 [Trifolium medium]|uniref:Uncharacterized protein n=1 Tax=Trifolium medium TaxID=97028 RepID=A0A392TN80_9FABA|nr:hypothetical protein [Trifolium medium]
MLPSSGSFFNYTTLALPLPLLNGTRRLTTVVRKTFDTKSRLNPSALIPLLCHEGAAGGSSTMGSRTTLQVS